MSLSSRRSALTVLAALGASSTLAALGGCGFALRQPPKLHFSSIALRGFVPRSPLALALQRQLAQQVQVLDAPDRADLVLYALDETRTKGVVASTAAAQVRQFTLWQKFSFRVATPSGHELIPRADFALSRDLSYSENFALAKEQEEADLYDDMVSDVAAQVLRRLAAVTL